MSQIIHFLSYGFFILFFIKKLIDVKKKGKYILFEKSD